ncbi:MAG: SIS domain-containing protein [Spirochaetia bacterium]|nr:SIS domain-containing protein [Spirochaetia bacterium]
MHMQNLVRDHIQRSIDVKKLLLATDTEKIANAGAAMAGLLQKGGKILTCGNGGSAGDAQHIATELLIRYRAKPERPSLPAISLVGDAAAVTAAGNDFGFDSIFSRQIEGLGRAGDGLLAISTSGNSPNVLKALQAARSQKMTTFLLTGGNGGKILRDSASLVDHYVSIPTEETARIQECHIMVGQIFCAIIEKELYGFD